MTWALYNQPITPTVDDKRERRTIALSTARPYVPIEHDRYLSATGASSTAPPATLLSSASLTHSLFHLQPQKL